MNVLMVGPDIRDKGGISTVVNNYLRCTHWKSTKIKYISTTRDGNKLIKILQFSLSLLKLCIYLPNVEIVHIHLASRGSWMRKRIIANISKLFNKKTVIHLHGAEFMKFFNEESSYKSQEQIRKVFRDADVIIALSDEWKKDIDSIIGIDKSIVVVNTVEIPIDYEKDYSKNAIICLGRIEDRKGVFDLVKVISRLKPFYPDIELFIGGDGEVRRLQALICAEHAEEYCKYIGWISGSEKSELYKKATICVLFSQNEGMPMTILEAMSHGIAIISTRVGGIPSLVQEGLQGILVGPSDVDGMQMAIDCLLSSPNLKITYGENARRRIVDEFSLEVSIKKLESIYSSMFEESK